MKQTTALDILKTGHNVFLTGSAGSGKTYTLNQYIHYLRARRVSVAVTASTGIAATHMSGITIHSWAGIGIKSEMTEKDLKKLMGKRILRERIKKTAVLVIDEISMLHAKQFNLVDLVLKTIKNSTEPFGGIQVILAGDFFQLPPVGEKEESNRDKFAFMSQAWLEGDFHVCYLSEQYRQKMEHHSLYGENDNSIADDINPLTLNDILNQIRRSQVTHQAVQTLENTINNEVNINRTRLYTHNVSVDKINLTELAKIDNKVFTYQGVGTGDEKLVEMLKKTVRTSDELNLKVGCKVMFVKNIVDLDVFNGTMGEVVGFHKVKFENSDDNIDKKSKYPVVKLNTGREVIAMPEEWMVEDEHGTVLASYTQVPLSLAWAITVHKSQGMTLDAAEIDLSRTFEMGQGYVALSRLKSLSGLKLLGLNEISMRLDPLARGADKRFMELSDEIQTQYQALTTAQLEESHQAFIIKSGGTNNKRVINAYTANREKTAILNQKNKQLKSQIDSEDDTFDKTKILLEESLSIAEIAEHRGLAQATIMRHIDKLKHQYPNLACEHLRPSDELINKVNEANKAIKAANDPNDFNEDGRVKLKPLFEYLNESIDYNTIRLALIFLD
ncbi:MAG: helicase [Gammaproteobacteria bacterium]|nr:MAG: helicase [Gammaproteobacteria bacterium]